MTLAVLALVLASAVLHATWNLWIKQMGGGMRGPTMILILVAFQTGAVSHIAPAREISILFGTYLGGRLLGEGDRARRLAAAAAFAVGVVALALT